MKLFKYQKSQVAIEFCLTYGWAFIMIFVLIFILVYFGVWHFSAPRYCQISRGLTCYDFDVMSDKVKIVLINNYGSTVKIDYIKVDHCDPFMPDPSEEDIREKKRATFTIEPCTILGKKYSSELTLTYTHKDSGLQHTARGVIKSPVN